MVPKIFEWIENAPINENLPKEKPVEEATEATAEATTDTSTGSDTAGNETVTVDDELSAVFFDF